MHVFPHLISLSPHPETADLTADLADCTLYYRGSFIGRFYYRATARRRFSSSVARQASYIAVRLTPESRHLSQYLIRKLRALVAAATHTASIPIQVRYTYTNTANTVAA